MNTENKRSTEKEVIPSVENRSELAKLSNNFKPSDVKFLLALETDTSEEECLSAAKGMTERLKRFVQSGFNHEKAGLDPNRYVHEEVTL